MEFLRRFGFCSLLTRNDDLLWRTLPIRGHFSFVGLLRPPHAFIELDLPRLLSFQDANSRRG